MPRGPDAVLRTPAVAGLLLLNVAVFIALLAGSGVVDVLALSGDPEVIIERPWTLVTVSFVHDNVGHLILMMLMLIVFGARLEVLTGPQRLLLTYLSGGVAGSVTVAVAASVSGSSQMSTGSSAAMFAIVAALAVVQPGVDIFGSKASHWVIAVVVFNLAYAFVWPVGSLAHMAGLGAGAVIGYRVRAEAGIDGATSSA